MPRVGEIKNGELWLRCPFCGDSTKDPRKSHFAVTPEGLYHCHRCGEGGRMKTAWLYQLAGEVGAHFFDAGTMVNDADDDEYLDLYEQLLPGPGNSRFSMLSRYHLGDLDVFESRDQKGEVIGLCLVNSEGGKRMIGTRALGYFGPKLIASLPALPYILVEGPYDVVDGRHICAFGLPSRRTLQHLKGHFLILCPDGDVWEQPKLLKRFKKVLAYANQHGVFILGFHRLPKDKDPDEVPVKEREFIAV